MRNLILVLVTCVAFDLAAQKIQSQSAPLVSSSIIPVVASTDGLGGTRYVSSLSIANPHPYALTVRMYVLPAGSNNSGYRASERTITLPPYGGQRIEDPLVSQWGLRGLAAIYLESTPAPGNDGAFIVESRVLNVANPDATFGLSLPASTGGLEVGDIGYGADAQNDARYRTNIGLLNNSAQTTTAHVELVNDDGTILGTRDFTLAPYSLLHTGINNVTSTPFTRATVRVIPDASLNGELIGYLSIVDGTTGDGTFSPLRPYRNVAEAGTVIVTMQRYAFGPSEIRLQAGKTYRLVFRAIDVAHGVTAVPQLGIDANDSIEAGHEYVAEVTPTAGQRGRYNIACTRVCGAGHGSMTAVIEIV